MTSESDIAPVPFRDPPSWLSHREHSRLASDEGDGSQTEVRERDRILIVEDDLLIATQIETTLTEAGFAITDIARTAEEAIEVATQNLPDLAVVDIRLAGKRDGIDTALELFQLHGIRCIFASAYADDEARQRAEGAAPLGWLQKPYSMVALTNMVRRAANELLRGKGPR